MILKINVRLPTSVGMTWLSHERKFMLEHMKSQQLSSRQRRNKGGERERERDRERERERERESVCVCGGVGVGMGSE